jgi:beta-N-acetylhexosaminidase
MQPFVLNASLPWMMTAHIVYQALDPATPATLSQVVINDVIRGRIGFEGVLVTDDLAMKALSGAPADLAVRALAVGCDIALYCSGDFPATEALLTTCPTLTPQALTRMEAGRTRVASSRMRLAVSPLAEQRVRLLG